MDRLIKDIKADKSKPPIYNLQTNNCTTYVCNLLGGIGVPIKTDPANYPPIFGGGMGLSPGTLGEDLILHHGGIRNPASGSGGSSSSSGSSGSNSSGSS
jgi:hypothetical protein